MSIEIDWFAAWYGNFQVWDSTINFWLTATFAVIVAIHALGERATKRITRLVAALYGAFSLYTALRGLAISKETLYLMETIKSLGIDAEASFFSSAGVYADALMLVIFLFGSVATTIFVLTASREEK